MDASTPCRWAIVGSRFHERVVDQLASSAADCLRSKGVPDAWVDVLRVPGAFEIPQAVSVLLGCPGRYRGVVAVGCVVRGDTPHFEYVCSETSRALMNVALETGVATGFGILTCDTMEQALDRAGGSKGDKGWEAAAAAWDLAEVLDAARRMSGR